MRRQILLAILFLSALPIAAGAQPRITLSPDTVVLEGIEPGGDAALFGISRRGMDFFIRVEPVREILTADAQGHAEFPLEPALAHRSVWSAVDLTTGEFALASPLESGVPEDPLDANALFASEAGAIDRLRHDHRVLEVQIVRPDKDEAAGGVWSARLADGDPASDADGIFNQSVTLDLGSLTSPDGTAPPESFEPGDVILLIDPANLEVSALRLEAATGPGGER